MRGAGGPGEAAPEADPGGLLWPGAGAALAYRMRLVRDLGLDEAVAPASCAAGARSALRARPAEPAEQALAAARCAAFAAWAGRGEGDGPTLANALLVLHLLEAAVGEAAAALGPPALLAELQARLAGDFAQFLADVLSYDHTAASAKLLRRRRRRRRSEEPRRAAPGEHRPSDPVSALSTSSRSGSASSSRGGSLSGEPADLPSELDLELGPELGQELGQDLGAELRPEPGPGGDPGARDARAARGRRRRDPEPEPAPAEPPADAPVEPESPAIGFHSFHAMRCYAACYLHMLRPAGFPELSFLRGAMQLSGASVSRLNFVALEGCHCVLAPLWELLFFTTDSDPAGLPAADQPDRATPCAPVQALGMLNTLSNSPTPEMRLFRSACNGDQAALAGWEAHLLRLAARCTVTLVLPQGGEAMAHLALGERFHAAWAATGVVTGRLSSPSALLLSCFSFAPLMLAHMIFQAQPSKGEPPPEALEYVRRYLQAFLSFGLEVLRHLLALRARHRRDVWEWDQWAEGAGGGGEDCPGPEGPGDFGDPGGLGDPGEADFAATPLDELVCLLVAGEAGGAGRLAPEPVRAPGWPPAGCPARNPAREPARALVRFFREIGHPLLAD